MVSVVEQRIQNRRRTSVKSFSGSLSGYLDHVGGLKRGTSMSTSADTLSGGAYLIGSQLSGRQTVEGFQRDEFHGNVVFLTVQNTRLD